ncbi:MAG TPA: GAF domain-containing protein, partial [Dongiaceae bacterium]|nr:GAF domain-containing protein [Dongiaceae bacterium]
MRSPKDGAHSSTAIGGTSGAAAGAARPPLTGTAPRPLVADLLSLRELQASLALEETDDAVVRVGTNAIVEILAIDCGLAIVETTPGRPPLRFGWLQGRAMTAPEMESLQRTLEREIAEVRDGSSGTRLLADAPAVPGAGAPALPAPVRALGFGAVLLLGLGSGGRRSGSLVLAARDAEAFDGEPAILAEILAQQMSEQCGRVRAAARVVRMTEPVVVRNGPAPAPGGAANGPDADVRRLQARVRALEAQAAIAAAVSLAHDTDRQVATALRKAIELTGHVAGAIYLVETNDACDDILRLAQGVGDEQWLETARLPRWRAGEGLPGGLWASGEGVAFAHLNDDPAGIGRDVLVRAGYRRMLAEPIRARGRTVGVLELFGDREGAYDADERALGRAIADQVGMAIHNARLVADLMRHGMDLEWQIERASSENRRALESRLGIEGSMIAASGEHDPEARALAVLERILEMTGADAACLHAVEPETGRFRLVSQRRFPPAVIESLYQRPADDPILQRAPGSGGVAIVDLATEEAVAAGWTRKAGVRTVALVPCKSGGATRGVLTLGSRYVGAFGEPARDAVAAVAALLGLVLECAEAESRGRSSVRSAAELADEVARVIAVDEAAESESQTMAPTSSTAPAASDPARDGAPPEPGQLAQAQKMSSIGKLATGIERELNSTIGAIMGHASHIRALVPDHNPVHDKAAVIEEQSHRAADLVRRVLTFSRGGVGKRERLDLNLLVDETRALLSRTLDPSIVLETRTGKDLPAIDVDPGELRQVLLNLAVNARDALPDGGRIVFETRSGHLDAAAVVSLPGLPPGDYVAVVISDNGAGMTPDVLDHAFEPFFTTKPLAQGSGLGLTVAQDIVRDLGGQIALSSAPGIGTAARLYLPVAPAEPAA